MFDKTFTGPAALVLAALAMTGGVAAQETDCRDPQTQTDMTICAGREYDAADAKLNASYKALLARYGDNDEAKQALRAAQRAWIAFRDAECSLTTLGVAGGSIEPMVRAMCLTTLTEQRAGQLDAHKNCPEGDVTCS